MWMGVIIISTLIFIVAIFTIAIAIKYHHHPHFQATKALTAVVDGCPNFLAGSSPSIADLLALSLAASNKIGSCPDKSCSFHFNLYLL